MTITVDISTKEFEKIQKGEQTFFIIKSDKVSEVGDQIIFHEQLDDQSYSGKEVSRQVTYIIADHKGLRPAYRTIGLKEKDSND